MNWELEVSKWNNGPLIDQSDYCICYKLIYITVCSLSNPAGAWVVVAIEGVIVTLTVVLVKCEGSVTARVGLKLAVGSLTCPQTSTAVMFIVTLAIL